MAIDALPTVPNRQMQDRQTFVITADAFLAALPTFASQANELVDELTAITVSVGSAVDDAEGFATAAQGYATAAAGSASDADGSADAAAADRVLAQAAKTAAEAARDSALSAYDSFDDRYLGAKSSNPTLDNDGNALAAGTLYYNTTVPEMRLYTGSAWVAAYVTGGSFLALSGGTLTGGLVTVASTTGGSGFRLPHGAAPTSKVNGDFWSTTGGLFAQINSFTRQLATLDGTETLTNKTVALGSNTVSGTLAQFNTACTDADFVSIAGSETLTNKTLTTPVLSGTASGTTAGRLGYASGVLTFGDGTNQRTVATLDGSQTLTNKSVALGSNTVTGTLAQFNTACTDADFASLAGSETLTNKTVALGSNSVSGTLAQFNTACTDADFASIAGAETLTNKTLTSPALNAPTVTGYTEALSAPAAGSSFTIDLSVATQFYLNTNANTTITLPTPAAGKSFTITVNYGGAHTITWSGGSREWAGGTVPTPTSASGKKDVYIFNCADGSVWDAAQAMANI